MVVKDGQDIRAVKAQVSAGITIYSCMKLSLIAIGHFGCKHIKVEETIYCF